MGCVRSFLQTKTGKLPRLAIFLSGSGSNAEQILQRVRANAPNVPFNVAVLVTDAPETSRARELGKLYALPVVENDIKSFYARHGETRVSIATANGQRLRQEWTDALRLQLAEYHIDFAVFAGFVPLTNITSDYPCLNVHPGDLTYRKEGKRYLVGLHTVPIERAILDKLDFLRSSVILALPYTGKGDDMDNGPILGMSQPVPINLGKTDLNTLKACVAARPLKRPKGGYGDALETVAKMNQEALKENGDWTVLPPVVFDFARGRFGADNDGTLHFKIKDKWHPIQTVVYGEDTQELIFGK